MSEKLSMHTLSKNSLRNVLVCLIVKGFLQFGAIQHQYFW